MKWLVYKQAKSGWPKQVVATWDDREAWYEALRAYVQEREGDNDPKVLVARALLTSCRVSLQDAPTMMRVLRHMDEVGHCNEIHDALVPIVDEGKAQWVGWGEDRLHAGEKVLDLSTINV